MSQSGFRFKQFTIIQDKTAMKVGTDGVLLGAWTRPEKAASILDIGTGTGLIALMMAQKSKALITAVEIEKDASDQAFQNIENSPWYERIRVHQSSVQDFSVNSGKKFDLIVSNPPYFQQSLKNPCEKRTLARHNDSLPLVELIQVVLILLESKGRFTVILPADSWSHFNRLAEDAELFPNRKLLVKPNLMLPPKRILVEYSFSHTDCGTDEIAIEKYDRHHYTKEYRELTRDYYLAF